MVVITIIVLTCAVIMLQMWKQANENNVRTHEVTAVGTGKPVQLFFISDTHARKINDKMIQNIKGQVDAVIIGGDFVDRRTTKQTLLENIQLLKTLGPIYFVWGNNDIEFDAQKLHALFLQHDVTVLENEVVKIGKDQNFSICGVTFSPNLEQVKDAFRSCDLNKTAFIAHNPELFTSVHKHFKPLLSIGGHLHGGQIRIFGWGIQPHGYFKQQGRYFELVSNGYGTTLLPIRLGAKPECHVIKIIFEQNKTFTVN
ncbi:metallophosphoesterase [Solibacillus daqui]|uniref:metallophosphoesterase n=1 Tax=Solibacillus daqui TaxID=2912187 RepID=UPI0023651E64|nr:metallophosphoesterase family protein [Solibacillus daqui]